ncbi:MAG: CBS domain-containing protein [Thermodesulfovibrionales bacterium]|nr:CBS domain-containing protein [Thermodesulfovibrionales bacterium]
MLTAKDIMTKNVTTVRAATTIEELARILMEHKISGAPVVDANENLIGIVTENDLISLDKRLHIPTVMRLFDAFIVLESQSKIEKEIKKMTAITVNDIYTKEVITVAEDTPVQDIATIMSEKKVHLIPVVEGKKIVGIIGKIDLIKGITGRAQ